MRPKLALFDAYGTLLDVGSATARLVQSGTFPALHEKGQIVSELWRTKQLQYTWLRSMMGAYVPFWQCTCDALDFALAQTGLDGDDALRSALLSLYRVISSYDDGARILTALTAYQIPRAILSNGNQDMLDEAISAAGLDAHLDAVLSVEDVGIYKPSPEVYQLACTRFDVKAEEVLFFSSNGWDIAGAAHFGYQTIWVNRQDQPAEVLAKGPDHIVANLDEAWDIAERLLANSA